MITLAPTLSRFVSSARRVALRRTARTLLCASLALLPGRMLWAQAAFPATGVGQTSAVQTVTVAPAAGQVATVEVLTLGTPALDYAEVAGGTCAPGNSYSTGDSCTVMVSFTPQYPGQRPGAVVLLNGAGAPMGTTLLSGFGNGPLGVFTPGTAKTIAGNGEWVEVDDGSPATSADLDLPFAVALDGAGNLYIADSSHNRIRKVDAKTQIISTYAGTGVQGYSGDSGLAINASIDSPHGLTIDGAGNLYFADTGNHVIRRIDAATGIITTVVGSGQQGYSGDGQSALAAEMNMPTEVVVDAAGNLYITDTLSNCIREVNATNGTIETIVGNGTAGYAGDGGPAASAELNTPYGIAFDAQGNLYIADSGNNRVREVVGGTISTVAGNGTQGFAGDGGPAVDAELYSPSGVAFDPAGNLYIGDTQNNRVRKVVQGTINTIFGNGVGKYTSDDVAANVSGLYGPYSVLVGPTGALYVSDYFDHRIRFVDSQAVLLTYPTAIRQGQTSPPQSQGMENDGDAPLALSGVTPDANAAVDPGTTTCNTTGTLAVDADCLIGAEFAPTEPGDPVLGHINLTGDMVDTPMVMTLEGQALALNSTTVSVISGKNPADAGQSVVFIATVASGTGTPSGTVTFMDGTQTIGTGTLSGTGTSTSASFATTALKPGAHSITAVYGGDSEHSGGTSAPLTETILGSTATALTTSGNPAAVNTALTLTATVTETTANGIAPDAIVVFYDGTTVIGTQTVNANGVATITTSSLTVGTHALSAAYNGDTYNEGSTSSTVQESIVQQSTTTTLISSTNPSIYGNGVTFTATVAVTGGGTPTGSVALFDGATQIGSSPLNGTTAAFSISNLQAGTHSLTAHYSGDSTSASSVSALLMQTVQQASTATVLASAPQPAIGGATTTLTATVTDTTGVGTPGGTVTFTSAGVSLGQGTVNASGVATITAKFAPGSPVVVASYSGDTNHSASSTTGQLTVQDASTTVAVTSSSDPSIFGTAVTFTVHVTGNGGVPGGTVTLLSDGVSIGSATLSAGAGAVTTSTLAVGAHAITASYAGDTNDAASSTSSALTQTVTKATPAETVSASPNSVIAGTTITITAQVKATGSTPVPTGAVTFTSGGVTLGTGTVNGAGVATITTSALVAGDNTITATYSGDASYNGVAATTTETTLRSTVATVIPSANPAIAGTAVTFTIQLSGATSTPQGTVTLLDGATVLTTVTLNVNGTATYSTSTLTPGTHDITAHYSGDASNGATTSAVLPEVLQAATTHTLLNASASSVTAGKPLTLTATISGNGGTATGSVEFLDGGKVLGQGTLNGTGVATFSTSTLAPGAHTLTAQYLGDTDDGSSVSPAVAVNVTSATTQVAVTSSINPATVTKAVTFTAQVSGNGATPTGTVSFTANGVSLGSSALNGSGVATVTAGSLPLGADTIVAAYAGDINDTAAQGSMTETVVQAKPLLSLTSSVNPAKVGASVTFTSSLTQNVGTTDGTVSFTADGASLGSSAVAADGIATLTVPNLTRGQHTIGAAYSGDTDNTTAQAAALTETVQQTTTTTLTPSANPAFGGEPVTFTVNVSGAYSASGGSGPGGAVTLYDGATAIGTQTLTGGSATFSVSTLSVGTHSLTAGYAGDTLDLSSTSAALSEQIKSGNASVTLTTSGSPVLLGTSVTFNATVTGTGAAPSGPVTFSADGKTIGTATLNAQGQASFTTASLAEGSHSIVAGYGGSADEAAASSAPVTEVVQAKTSTVLSTSVNPVLAGTPIQFTAQVTSTGGVAPTGTITLLDGGATIGTAPVSATGSATFSLSTLAFGTHVLTASYSGDGVSLPSVSTPLTQVITAITTTVHLGASATAVTTDQQLTLLASVDSNGTAPFSGTVTFTANGTVIGTAPASGTGNATLSPSLAPGTYTVTASYGGDSYNAPGTSPSMTIVVSQAQDFTAAASKTGWSMPTNTNQTITITVKSMGGYSDQIDLGCANLPYEMTCTFSQPSVTLAADGTQTATVTIDTSSPLNAGGVAANKSTPTGIYFAGVFPGALWWLLAGRRKRKRGTAFLAAIAAVGLLPMMLFSGCSGISMTSASPGQYTLQVTATGVHSQITHTIDLSVDVTK
jgi:sugar lactone lactonase YvrE